MKKGKIKYIVQKIVSLIFIAISSILLYQLFIKLKETPSEEKTYGTRLSAEENEITTKDISSVLEKVSGNVVGISKMKNIGSSAFLSNASENLGLGSGIIISSKGYILTNQHVIGEKGKNCYITTANGETYSGKTTWSNQEIDLAIVKVDTRFQQQAVLGNSDSIRVGQNVYAIGNPIGFEFQRTVTGGIISAINRTIKLKDEDESYSYMSNLIQTDATINPGNSGGPLVDGEGKVIGINTIKITSAEGIGFAIPINIVKPIIEKYEQEGEFKEAYLGVYVYDSSIISYINAKDKREDGVYIEKVLEDGPAAITELQKGDKIIQIDTTNINKLSELLEYIYTKKPGEEVTITFMRTQVEKKIKLILGEKEEI